MTAHARRRRRSPFGAVVGTVGEILITLGVILGLFLVWELWWTNVQSAQAQAKDVASLGWAYEPQKAPPKAETSYLTPSKKAPKVDKEPALLKTFATLYVPRFDKDYAKTITEGTDKATVLDTKGIGHYVGTAMPGAVGNFAIAGHRTTYGKPFNKIDSLKAGDPVIVQTKDGWYVYAVTDHLVPGWQNGEQVAPVPGDTTGTKKPTKRLITMTSCHPVWQPIHRYIVHGELVYWAPPDGDKVPKELVTGTFDAGMLDGITG
jgi:sortase A